MKRLTAVVMVFALTFACGGGGVPASGVRAIGATDERMRRDYDDGRRWQVWCDTSKGNLLYVWYGSGGGTTVVPGGCR